MILTGEVISIPYRATSGPFAVIRLQDDSRALVTAIGPLAPLLPGERVRLTGEWIEDPLRGRQFRAREYLSLLPESLDGLERYLSSGLVPGIGEGLVRKLVETFGDDLFRALDEGDPQIAAIRGLGKAKATALIEAWQKERTGREALIFLAGCGVTGTLAERILQRYGEKTLERIRQNPYRLAEDIHGIGFQRADEIAQHLGVNIDSVARARAALLHLLGRSVEEGHVYLPLRRLLEQAEPLELSPGNVLRALNGLEADGELVIETVGEGEADRAVYLANLHRAEVSTGARLADLAAQPLLPAPWRQDEALTLIETKLGIVLGSKQREAVLAALTAPLLTITGGPGTGKTTLVRAILELYGQMRVQVQLAAPTGRAARRLQETTGAEARTIHRLLEVQLPDQHFRRNRENPIDADVVLVDEASMIDLPLFDALLAALKHRSRLILVGDVHQLPPVGPGNVLEAVIRAAGAPVVVLDEVYRQANSSLIALNAQRINRGQMPLLPRGEDAQRADFFYLEEEEPEAAVELIVDLVQRRLPARYGFDPRVDLQVLSPSHKGAVGVSALNERLQAALNPEAPGAHEHGHRLRIGDKVLQSRNNYDKELFNGDVGVVISLDARGATVRFDSRLVDLNTGELDDLELGYAMTVHKAQGSEFPAVVVPVMDAHTVMLRRNLLYTAVTRARKLLVIVGSGRALERAVTRETGERRYSRLAARLSAKHAGVKQV